VTERSPWRSRSPPSDLAAGPGAGHPSLSRQLTGRDTSRTSSASSSSVSRRVNHHTPFQSLVTTDRLLAFLNLTLLPFIVAILFGTATMSAYLRGGGADAHLAAALYVAILDGMTLSFSAIFVWSIRTDERRHTPLPARAARTALARCSIGSVSYVVAIGLALGAPPRRWS
jgi:uncharacterized membrane protein